MIKNVPLVSPEENFAEVRKRIFEKASDFETLNYFYVVDKQGLLKGVISIKDVLQQKGKDKVSDLMVKELVRVRPHTDQERVALLALRNSLKAVPVIDKQGRFLGVVPSDTILQILHSEDVEDILRSAGIAKYNTFSDRIFQASPITLTKLRVPWLILGLFGGLLAAKIVGFFEGSLRNNFVLAAFIPLVVYMADAVGTQTETLYIRSLVYNINTRGYFLKEVKVSLLIALILGILLSLVSYLWFRLSFVSLTLGVSLFFTIVVAFGLGIFIPYLLNQAKKDPAIISGPVGTIIRDILSLISYFLIASGLLNFFS